jgi:hypothetical protein
VTRYNCAIRMLGKANFAEPQRQLLARCGGSRQCSAMSAIEGKPDGRRTRLEPALLTPSGRPPALSGRLSSLGHELIQVDLRTPRRC